MLQAESADVTDDAIMRDRGRLMVVHARDET